MRKQVWLNLQDGAEYAGVHTMTLRRWGAAGRIRLYRAGPRVLRVRIEDLDALMKPVPTSDPAA